MTDFARKLPADPEGMNDDRAEWALEALARFMQITGTDREDAVSDLLCDLMHLADREGGETFARSLERAQLHYDEETFDDDA